MKDNYDVVIIGAGNAGQAAAAVVREAGKSVLVVDRRDFGGTCALRGCVPKKVLVAAAEVLDTIARAEQHHIRVPGATLDWKALVDRKRSFVRGVSAEVERDLREQGIDVVHASAHFAERGVLEIVGRRVRAGKVIVAAGSSVRRLPIDGSEYLITSEDILELDELPGSVVFVGAGVIALEFSHVFARAKTKVTLLQDQPRALARFDPDAVDALVAESRRLGIEIITGITVRAIRRKGEQFVVEYEAAGKTHLLEADCVAHGAGRVPDLASLELERAGVRLEEGKPKLDGYLRSRDNPDVLFAGDAVPESPQLSPVATYEGKVAGSNALGGEPSQPDYAPIPAVVFTVPALAMVGRTEQGAREQGLVYEVRKNDMTGWRSARTYAETTAFAKVLIDREQRILGAHLVGHGAQETIHAFSFAMRQDLSTTELKQIVTAYPTFHADIRYML
jgi:glutathione reductase (NADPH)